MSKLFSPLPWHQDIGIAMIRLITAIFLIYHGREIFDAAKMTEYLGWDMFKASAIGKLLVYTGKAGELVGGILLFLGLFTRLAAIIITGTLGYIAFFVGHGKIWYEDQHPFLFVLLAMVFIFTGPGSWSMDRLFFNKK